MDVHFLSLLLLSISLFTLSHSTTTTTTTNDTAALFLFRSQIDPHGTLLSNWTTSTNRTTACTANWVGVKCNNNRVTALSLPSLNLRGPIDSISSLDQLRLLDLHDNRFNGSFTPISKCLNLKFIYLSSNDFSGEIPPELSSLRRLLRLDLSDNNLRGAIPTQFSKLSRLLTLHLQDNELSGTIPKSLGSLPQLKNLNLSNNQLYGMVPQSLISRYGENSFSGNEGLCGSSPLPQCSYTGTSPAFAQTVTSNPSSFPSSTVHEPNKNHKRLSSGSIVAIVVVNSVILLVITSFVIAYYCRKYSGNAKSMAGSEGSTRRSSYSGEKRVYANGGGGGDNNETNVTDKNRLVFFDRKNQFELEDLLRASAEMLGKGSLGSVYKAVLDDGFVVAVKRLKDANPCSRKEFEQYMDVIGKLKHPNIVRFRAYYYAKEEKLLVYDYLPNGSLHYLLHGNRGPGRIPLDWTTRISLILGAARGLAKIHEEYEAMRVPHGNVKSSNILLDKNGVACISDFGLSLLLNPVHAVARLGGYKAPEQAEIKKLSQKSDVYSFGVLLLEVLSGRVPSQYPSPAPHSVEEDDEEWTMDLPKWVRSVVRDEWTAEVFDEELLRYKNIEEELMSMLHLALACVVPKPENRPKMGEVVKMIEEIRMEESPLGDDYDESRNSLSPSLATTDDGLA
ncbi:Leucine-rich repeat receptor-like protein kinase PXC1 [Abeliophyllum distichum]|uniref:Leucine-rich repeat receptor-like protein kinase PXC1 n=1 Tax=Abeliophyllum distichum TaxID=126358 RepID=A0ABD1RFR6_9LAMI